jgi:hypothetical protein
VSVMLEGVPPQAISVRPRPMRAINRTHFIERNPSGPFHGNQGGADSAAVSPGIRNDIFAPPFTESGLFPSSGAALVRPRAQGREHHAFDLQPTPQIQFNYVVTEIAVTNVTQSSVRRAHTEDATRSPEITAACIEMAANECYVRRTSTAHSEACAQTRPHAAIIILGIPTL